MKKEEKQLKKSNKVGIIIGVLILAFIIIYLIVRIESSTGTPSGDVILGNNPSSGNIINNDNSKKVVCKEIQVPYQDTESYIEQEPYQATVEYKVNLKYEVVNNYKETFYEGFLDVWARGIVEVRNVDSETGSFTVKQTFKTLEDGSNDFTSSQYIMPGETKIFTKEYDISAGEDFDVSYVITPPQKTLTRTVTKWRDVTKKKFVNKIIR